MVSAPATDPAGPLRVGMVAGETSGDLLAAAVLEGLQRQLGSADHLQAAGIGGPAMAARGFDAWWQSEELAVRGYVEVLREYPRLRGVRNRLHDRMVAWKPDVFVGGRIEGIRRSVDRMLLLFPFEKKLYDAAGIPATYVGHPLADAIPLHADTAAARRALDLPEGRQVVAVLPGSRGSEITYIAPVFAQTIAWLARRRPELVFVVPAATDRLFGRLRTILAGHGLPEGTDCRLVMGRSHDAIAAADTVLVASGTATLEVALFRKPMVIGYRMAWASFELMRRMGYLPWVGLPNILCNESVVPEFLQSAATPEALGTALLAQLDDPALAGRLGERFAALHEALRCDCAQRAAEALIAMCPAGRRPPEA
jgi:lipid-A-disaccharide synthase